MAKKLYRAAELGDKEVIPFTCDLLQCTSRYKPKQTTLKAPMTVRFDSCMCMSMSRGETGHRPVSVTVQCVSLGLHVSRF